MPLRPFRGVNRLGAKRAFLMVSGTLNRETDVIENIRRAMVAGALATTAVGAQGRIPSAEELERAVGGPHP